MLVFNRLFLFGVVVLFALTACGGGGGGGNDDDAVVTPANSSPRFTSNGTVSLPENTTQAYLATATDPDGDTLTYTITGGEDAAACAVLAATGVVTFLMPPDFENPTDADGDNTYSLQLTVSDGNGGSDVQTVALSVTDEGGIRIDVQYPPPGGNLGGDVTQTTVRGRLDFSEAPGLTIADVNLIDVNGLSATQDLADPSFFSATIPISAPTNTIDVEVQPISGGVIGSYNSEIANRPLYLVPQSAALDAANDRLLITENARLLAVNLASGEPTIISDRDQAGPSELTYDTTIALDSANNRLFSFEYFSGSVDLLFETNLTTGDRNDIFIYFPSSPTFYAIFTTTPQAVEWDPVGGRLYILEYSFLHSVDPSVGEIQTISGGAVGSGIDNLNFAEDFSLDLANNRALILNSASSTFPNLLAVDLTTGARTVISGNSAVGEGTVVGSGAASFSGGQSIALDTSNNRVLIEDQSTVNPLDFGDEIVAVDLSTGDRTIISGATVGSGPAVLGVGAMALDAPNGRLLVGTSESSGGGGVDGIQAIDLVTGNRTVVSTTKIGTGPSWLGGPGSLRGLEFDPVTRRYLVGSFNDILAVDAETGNRSAFAAVSLSLISKGFSLDPVARRVLVAGGRTFDTAVLSYDLATGVETVVSLANPSFPLTTPVGSGPEFPGNTRAAVLDPGNNRLLVLADDFQIIQGAVVAVDLTSGDRSILADATNGTGPDLDEPQNAVLDAANDRLLVTDSALESIIDVDLVTGNRSIVSGPGTGTGPSIGTGFGIALDPTADRALVTDANAKVLLAVNLATGNRTILSGDGTGTGPEFIFPDSLHVSDDGRFAQVVDSSWKVLMVVDLTTGDRAVASK